MSCFCQTYHTEALSVPAPQVQSKILMLDRREVTDYISNPKSQSKVSVKWLLFLLHIREIVDSDLNLETDLMTEDVHDFRLFLATDPRIISRTRSGTHGSYVST
jgi:hypothetical protein